MNFKVQFVFAFLFLWGCMQFLLLIMLELKTSPKLIHSENTPGENHPEIVIFGESTAGRDLNSTITERRDFIRMMMKSAWNSYEKYAWGQNELQPVNKSGNSEGLFGPGATIVDSLDTLFIMGLREEYNNGRDWVANHLDFDNHDSPVSVFEMTIRYIGSFLSMYSLTKDTMFKDKAKELADKLFPAFKTSSGIPMPLINMKTGETKNFKWLADKSVILCEIGSLRLEFEYLSEITNNSVYNTAIERVMNFIAPTSQGLYNNFVSLIDSGIFNSLSVSLGSFGDSFYEYLLKSFILFGDKKSLKQYNDAIDSLEINGFFQRSETGEIYIAEMRHNQIVPRFDHLACFTGGMMALGAYFDPDVSHYKTRQSPRSQRDMMLAEELTSTCHNSYAKMPTGLGPDRMHFGNSSINYSASSGNFAFKLRPELIESYFVLWRITHNPKYREWAWETAKSIWKHCFCPESGGFTGIKDVRNISSEKDDRQQTYFLAETLKYLYLIFSSDELLDLNLWVFNTEAHPLPIKNANPLY